MTPFMRIAMMGTGRFAVPTFKALLGSQHDVVALVTRPPKPIHGKRRQPVNPMLDVAQEHNLPVLMPPDVNDESTHSDIEKYLADLFVVCDYGQILSRGTLSRTELGGINLHGSLLPKYRGAAPVNWAIYHGETETGVTVIHMTARLDSGPCLASCRTPIGSTETAVDVELRLAELGVEPVFEAISALDQWDRHSAIGTAQSNEKATRAPRLKKLDGWVDWRRTAKQIYDQWRAFVPWPGTYTNWKRDSAEPLRLLLKDVEPIASHVAQAPPGTVTFADGERLDVATGQGSLRIHTIQPAGKRALTAAEFQRGYRISLGDVVG